MARYSPNKAKIAAMIVADIHKVTGLSDLLCILSVHMWSINSFSIFFQPSRSLNEPGGVIDRRFRDVLNLLTF